MGQKVKKNEILFIVGERQRKKERGLERIFVFVANGPRMKAGSLFIPIWFLPQDTAELTGFHQEG